MEMRNKLNKPIKKYSTGYKPFFSDLKNVFKNVRIFKDLPYKILCLIKFYKNKVDKGLPKSHRSWDQNLNFLRMLVLGINKKKKQKELRVMNSVTDCVPSVRYLFDYFIVLVQYLSWLSYLYLHLFLF